MAKRCLGEAEDGGCLKEKVGGAGMFFFFFFVSFVMFCCLCSFFIIDGLFCYAQWL